MLGDLNNVQIVSLKNKDGNTVSTIDGNTPAGTYTITLGYRLNGSNNKNMFITNTAKIVISLFSQRNRQLQAIQPRL